MMMSNTIKHLLPVLLLIITGICSGQSFMNTPIASVPFRLIDDIIYIDITINKVDRLTFIFDTGASTTLINPQAADRLALKNGNSSNGYGAAGSYDVEVYPNNNILLGDHTISNITLIKNMDPLESTVFGEELDGVIGYDVLSKYIVDINYDDQLLILYSFEDYQPVLDYKIVDFQFFSNLPYIYATVTINDKEYEDIFIIDTGGQLRVLLVNPFIEKHNLRDKLGNHFTLSKAIGISKEKVDLIGTKIGGLSLFDTNFADVPMITSFTDRGIFGIPQIGGILGNGILKRFNTVYDYSRQKMYITPNNYLNDSFNIDCFGGSFERRYVERRLIIESVIKGSVAEEAGFIPGDEILSLDGQLIKTITNQEFLSILELDGKIIEISFLRKNKPYIKSVKLRKLI